MILLNLGCGATRPGPPWVNVDGLESVLTGIGGPGAMAALEALRQEPNYIDTDLIVTPWQWETESIDGLLLSHVVEHFNTQDALRILKECYRVLWPGGCLRVSVPDASFFRSVHDRDVKENWTEVFGEGNHVGPETAYRSVALFFSEHLQTYTVDALWCQLVEAGFDAGRVHRVDAGQVWQVTDASTEMAKYDNRARFSLYCESFK